jgi:putative heme-binding domain-containing protein
MFASGIPMTRSSRVRALLAAALACSWLARDTARAGEAWADPRLEVQDGLVLWLDAGRQPKARAALDLDPIPDGAPLATWLDGSGNAHHLVQRSPQAMPRYVVMGRTAVVRFDGIDDCLLRDGALPPADALTILVAAAPRSNAGGFRAFLAAGALGRNDYVSGVTLDQGPAATMRLECVNVEGRGFGGAVDLLHGSLEFGTFHTLGAVIGSGPRAVTLAVDGKTVGARDRVPGSIALDTITVGARCYSNTAEPPGLSGFLEGDLAEVLIYRRVLSESELRSVGAYLAKKSLAFAEPDGAARPVPLVAATDPAPVQMLAPGFTVRELGVGLTNVNNVRAREDGSLIALGYDGNVWLLRDRDGDGVEETAEPYWQNPGTLRAPVGMALVPAGHPHGPGVIVAAKGRCVLLADEDGDDRADREIIVAQGWKELPHGVDAVGVALRADGTVFFGLGAADYTNPYLLDDAGDGHFDLASERGTVLAVAPDFRSRRIFCTGVRFPVGLAFHPSGDLFATDQEGATWLANGNPFDELLQLEEGRHYGFPPRHPRHLPRVIDEPSVCDYGPQHQSTCGFCFDVTAPGRELFGPAHFDGDALVTGYSRGKLFRTELARSAAGWVARNHVLACLTRLPVDVCLERSGALVVASHSGAPDWGSGPAGKGSLYQIAYTDRDAPQPVFAWAEGPREVRVAFDRALDRGQSENLAARLEITYGAFVRPGDRFESLRPGYEAVRRQLAEPRFRLPIESVRLMDERRTLALLTAPQDAAVPHAIRIAGSGREPAPGTALPQADEVELDYDLHGVEATFRARDPQIPSWSGWLPHLELGVARELTRGSAGHDALWRALTERGTLTLRARLQLANVLRPALQPGAHLDHEPPPEQVTLRIRCDAEAELRATNADVEGARPEWLVRPRSGSTLDLEIALATGGREPPRLEVAVFTREDPRPRALALDRFLPPWAAELESDAAPREAELVASAPAELQGASFLGGRAVFFSEAAMCAKCHRLRGEGTSIGPDLDNLSHRDYTSVLNDILRPSAAIHPDHVTCAITLDDGREFAGVIRTRGDGTVAIGEAGGKITIVKSASLRAVEPLATSIMPGGLENVLTPKNLADLMAFLMKPVPEPAPIEGGTPPPPRAREEVEPLLAGAATAPAGSDASPATLVLVAGAKDHGPGEHDYPDWQRRFGQLLALGDDVKVETAWGWPSAAQLAGARTIVFYSANPEWSAARAADLDAVLERGGGLVFIHFAVNGQRAVPALAERIGLAWDGAVARYRHGALDLEPSAEPDPILRGLGSLHLVDESYWRLTGDPSRIHVLASCREEGSRWPLVWTREERAGRVFVSIPGHYRWTFDDPLFRVLLLRGIAWTARLPVDALTPLALIGARARTK